MRPHGACSRGAFPRRSQALPQEKLSRTDSSGKVARDLGPPRSNRPRLRPKAPVGLTVHCGTACRRGEGIPSRGGFPAGRSWVSLTRVLFLGSDALSASHPAACVTSGLPPLPVAQFRLRNPPSQPASSALLAVLSSTRNHPWVTSRCREVSHRLSPVSRRFQRKPPPFPAASQPFPTAPRNRPIKSAPASERTDLRLFFAAAAELPPPSWTRHPSPLRLISASNLAAEVRWAFPTRG